MSKDSEYRPRLTLDIPEDVLNELRTLIPWGIRSQLFTVIIKDFNEILKKHGSGYVIGALLQRDIDLKTILQVDLAKEE